jgi:hypothetical protein
MRDDVAEAGQRAPATGTTATTSDAAETTEHCAPAEDFDVS